MRDSPFVSIAEMHPRPVAWLWEHRIPFGSLTLLEGDPGQAKSTLTYDIAARLTSGKPMPGESGARLGPAGVVLLQGEDDFHTVVRPRLDAAGADAGRVLVYDRRRVDASALLTTAGLSHLEREVTKRGIRLVVIDPLANFVTESLHSSQGASKALRPLEAFARETGVAVLLVRHLAKGGAGNPLYRGAGSIRVISTARSALLVANDPAWEDPHRHVLVQTKSNLASAPGLAYRTRLAKGGPTSGEPVIAVEWVGRSPCTARDLARPGDGEPRALADAGWVLYSILSERPVPAREAIRLGLAAGIAKRTLDRAKKQLGVVTRKEGSGPGSRWTWELPDDEARLRPYRERDLLERKRQVWCETAAWRPGQRWLPPPGDLDLYLDALAERGLTVTRIGGHEHLWREADLHQLPLLEAMAQARESNPAAGVAYRDFLAELGVLDDLLFGS
ncbi:MAG: AAA family ATPase [Gemmataceae bacterium]